MYCHAQTNDGLVHHVTSEPRSTGGLYYGSTACNRLFVWVNTFNVPKGTQFAAKAAGTVTCLRCVK